MATKIVGKLDWDSADLGGSDFVKLEEGSNVVRILTQPYQYYNHWSTDESGQQCKVRCAMENCPACQRGEKATARWLVGVLVRKTGKPGILEIGPQIFKQIKGLKSKDKWGDPRTYDIDIVRNPKGSQPLYVVSPEPKEMLSKEEVAMVKSFIEGCDLTEMTKPSTAEEVREKLGIAAPAAKKSAHKEESFEFDSDEGTATEDSDGDFKFED